MRRWERSDLVRRLCHALDISLRVVRRLAANGYTDRAEPAANVRPEKVIAETAFLLLGAAECADPGTVSWLYKLSQTEAKKAGRAGIPFEVSIATFISDDLVKARAMCRYEPELLTNLIWHLMKTYPLEQLPPSLIKGFEWLADVDDWWDKHDWSKQATVAGHERITDEMVDRLCVVGSVETCIGKLRDLQNIGVERFCAYLVGSIEEIQGQLRIFGDSIIPVFSKMQSTGAKSRNQTEGTTNVR